VLVAIGNPRPAKVPWSAHLAESSAGFAICAAGLRIRIHSPDSRAFMTDFPHIDWTEANHAYSARWRSEAGVPAPKRVVIVGDDTTADDAYHLASEGSALLYRGDFQNARQLLQAIARRIEQKPRRAKRWKGAPASASPPEAPGAAFNRHRLAQSQRARTLGAVLVPLAADYSVPLRRAPDVRLACEQTYGPASVGGAVATTSVNSGDIADAALIAASAAPIVAVVSLRELLGLIGAYEWRKKGVEVPAAGGRIHPHYGVFSPVRGEYIDLVASAPLPSTELAFDIGTGTGVLAVVLAQRGVKHIVATDCDPRALACATENVKRLGFADRVSVVSADLFPPGQAPLIVCNPPWVPARPSSPIESAVFDPESRMLLGFLKGLREHLSPGGEGWLILSDFAEHLGLRPKSVLEDAITAGGLTVIARHDIKPVHPRSSDRDDPLHKARAAELTSLWRLGVA